MNRHQNAPSRLNVLVAEGNAGRWMAPRTRGSTPGVPVCEIAWLILSSICLSVTSTSTPLPPAPPPPLQIDRYGSVDVPSVKSVGQAVHPPAHEE
ncbi:unnamed protein product [Arctogadus glacialis]